MPRSLKTIASELSLDELRQLLAVKEKLTGLEKRKAQLEQELAVVTAQIDKLVAGAGAAPRKQAGRRKAANTAKKTAKAAAKKTVKKTAKKAVKKTAKKAARKKAAAKPKATVETVVVDLIRGHGKPMAFQDILAKVTEGKLVKTKSKNFANVLRRTISTSKLVKRVGRGVYGVK